jgi:hypothetical protein
MKCGLDNRLYLKLRLSSDEYSFKLQLSVEFDRGKEKEITRMYDSVV